MSIPSNFNADAYFANNQLAGSGMTAEQHWQNFGQYENRDPTGAVAGAQINYWDNPDYAAAQYSAPAATPQVNYASNIPGNASFYEVPVTYNGQTWNVNLGKGQWDQLLSMTQGGMSFNDAALRLSGDGIGAARIIGDSASGYLPYGVDVMTGRPTTANASYSETINGGLGSGMYGASTSPNGTVTYPGNVGVSGSSQAFGGSGVGAASGTGGQSGNGLVQGVDLGQYNQNPYLSQMGTVLTNLVTDNLQRHIMPGIRSNAVAAGGFGGSRQGVVEANAMKDANQTISDALTGAYFQDFTNQMNRNLAQYGQNQNFFSNQRGQDLQAAQLGANLWQMGNTGMLGQGSGLSGIGSAQQQAPWQVVNNANAGLGQWSGYGTTTSANQGGGLQGAIGGALGGAQLGGLLTGSGTPSTNYGLSSGSSGLGLQAPTTWKLW